MAIKTNRSRIEIRKNKDKKKAVSFESASRWSLKGRRKKMEIMKRLMMMKRSNDAESLDPKMNHTIDSKDAGNSQPAIPRTRYSFEVSCSPKTFFNAKLIRF